MAVPPQANAARHAIAPQPPVRGPAPPQAPGNPLDSPEYRAALAAFEARAVPVHQVPAPAERSRAPVAAPSPGQRGLGVLLVAILCALAAIGGYLAVHWLSGF
jgi:hypothetical protein